MAEKGINVRFSVKGNDLAEIENITKEPLPIKGPFHISSHLIAAKPDKIQMSDMLIELGNSKLNGSVALDRSAKKPQISGNLVSETLDLRLMLIKTEQKTAGAKEKTTKPERKSDKLFQNTPLKLDGLHLFNAAVDLQIKQLLLPKVAIDNIETKVRLKDGNLTVNPMTASIGGGKLANSLNVHAKENMVVVDLNVDVKQMNLGEMLKKQNDNFSNALIVHYQHRRTGRCCSIGFQPVRQDLPASPQQASRGPTGQKPVRFFGCGFFRVSESSRGRRFQSGFDRPESKAPSFSSPHHVP